MSYDPRYPAWVSHPRGDFRLILTSHANQRLHERKAEAWDARQATVVPGLREQLLDLGYGLWQLHVRGYCKVVLDDLRFVFHVSGRIAKVITVIRPEFDRSQPDR